MRRRRQPRIRCTGCGSTRVRGITLGYHDGRLALDERGQVIVDTESGAWVEHDAAAVEPGSVVCENCGSGKYRVEGGSP